jgi:hypothetical protein
MLQTYFKSPITIIENRIYINKNNDILEVNQSQTTESFSSKWNHTNNISDLDRLYNFQYEWFLKLYGFNDENNLANFLQDKNLIIDTGCGLGYKSYWLSKLAPHATVIGIDISDSINIAASNYLNIPNLFFLKADISNSHLKENICDFVVCDQVIMHTENPEKTFLHLSEITSTNGEFACYFYRKKALPRELIDDYFRIKTHNIPDQEMWELSEQLTLLGKTLSELNVTFKAPDIPLLNIKGGEYDIQRFIYWNFLKCFWKNDWGFELSKITNFDWYSPSNAKRYSKNEIIELINNSNMAIKTWHEEEACFSGRFYKIN